MHVMGTQLYQSASGQQLDKMSQNGSSTSSKPAIERGASWSYGETKILLALWTQDIVQRQLTNSKRTRHVWQKIAERIRENGYDRTADQVRTRVFNMIAEYRRILKNPTPERRKKCIFFEALHKIYQAKDTNGLESATTMSYGDFGEKYNFEPIDFTNADENGDCNDDNSDEDRSEIFAYSMSPNSFTGNLNDHNSNDSVFDHCEEPAMPPMKRSRLEHNTHPNQHQHHLGGDHLAGSEHPLPLPSTASFDSSAFQVLIDRMFTHLSRETDVLREWINLERQRQAHEIERRNAEKEREMQREKNFLEVLTKLQDQVFTFLAKQQPTSAGQPCPTNSSDQPSPASSTVGESTSTVKLSPDGH